MAALNHLHDQYGDEVAFLLVYLKEAHAADERPSRANDRTGIHVLQPVTIDERTEIAHHMCRTMKISLPTVVDEMDDRVGQTYNAHPDRIYLVGHDGRIAYQGEAGLRGVSPQELEQAILVAVRRD